MILGFYKFSSIPAAFIFKFYVEVGRKGPLFSILALFQCLIWLLPSWGSALYLAGCWMPGCQEPNSLGLLCSQRCCWEAQPHFISCWCCRCASEFCAWFLYGSSLGSPLARVSHSSDTNLWQVYLESSSANLSATFWSCLHYTKTKDRLSKPNIRASLSLSVCSAKFMFIQVGITKLWGELLSGYNVKL